MVDVKPLGPIISAETGGVRLGHLSGAEFNDICTALAQHEVLVFRDQRIGAEQQIAFGCRFGELTVSPFSPNAQDMSELIVLDNHPGAAPPHRHLERITLQGDHPVGDEAMMEFSTDVKGVPGRNVGESTGGDGSGEPAPRRQFDRET